MRRILSYFFAAALFLAIAFPASAIEYGMLGGKPANPDPNVENSVSWFIYKLNAGEAKDDAVRVLNLFENDLDVLVYAADTTASSGGGFALEQFSEPKDEVGAWVRFYPEAVPEYFAKILEKKEGKITAFCRLNRDELDESLSDIIGKTDQISDGNFSTFENWCRGTDSVELKMKAKEQKDIPFVISVPEKADVGEHTGGILVQKKAAEDASGAGGSSVKLTTRVGVRIYQTVPGEIIRKITIEDFKIIKNFKEFSFSDWFGKEKKPKEFLIETKITNSGNVSITHSNNVNVDDALFGKRTEKVERSFQVLKKDKFVANYSWKKPLFGYYKFQGEIKYQGSSNEESLKTPELTLWVIPWREITIFILITGLIVSGYWLWRRNHKKKYGGLGWVEYKVKKNDDLSKLVAKFKVDWKVFTKTNKLKAPYILSPGQVILVPPSGVKKTKKQDEDNLADDNQDDGGDNIPENKPEAVVVYDKITEKIKKTRNNLDFLKNSKVRNIILAIIGALLLLGAFFAVWKIAQNKKETEIKEKISITSLGAGGGEVKKEESVPAKEKEEPLKAKAPQEVTVKILNGGAAPGTAGKIKDFLVSKDYIQTEAKNAADNEHTGTIIFYKEDVSKKEAEWIKEMLAGKEIRAEIKLAESEEEKSADIVIILGK